MRIEPSTLLCVSEKLKSFVRNIEIVNLFAPPQTTHSVPLSSIVTKPFSCSGSQHQLQLTWIPTTNHQSIHIFFLFFCIMCFHTCNPSSSLCMFFFCYVHCRRPIPYAVCSFSLLYAKLVSARQCLLLHHIPFYFASRQPRTSNARILTHTQTHMTSGFIHLFIVPLTDNVVFPTISQHRFLGGWGWGRCGGCCERLGSRMWKCNFVPAVLRLFAFVCSSLCVCVLCAVRGFNIVSVWQ